MADFQLDDRLAGDSFAVCDLPLSQVRVFNDQRYPWLILIPRHPDLAELIDLTEADQLQAMREISMASHVLKQLCSPHKLNVAALGNHVRQLHIHVIARQQDDAAWPNPVWGVGTSAPYDAKARAALIERLGQAFATRIS